MKKLFKSWLHTRHENLSDVYATGHKCLLNILRNKVYNKKTHSTT